MAIRGSRAASAVILAMLALEFVEAALMTARKTSVQSLIARGASAFEILTLSVNVDASCSAICSHRACLESATEALERISSLCWRTALKPDVPEATVVRACTARSAA